MLTEGIQNLPENLRFEVLQQVRSFDSFTPDNDPYGEHDFGAFNIEGRKIFWKFDYFDKQSLYLSAVERQPPCPAATTTLAGF
jgi:hypothetical protein